jgi:hypothetical protein
VKKKVIFPSNKVLPFVIAAFILLFFFLSLGQKPTDNYWPLVLAFVFLGLGYVIEYYVLVGKQIEIRGYFSKTIFSFKDVQKVKVGFNRPGRARFEGFYFIFILDHKTYHTLTVNTKENAQYIVSLIKKNNLDVLPIPEYEEVLKSKITI